MTQIVMNEDKLRWCCFQCGKVVDDDKTRKYEDIKQGDPLNPLCCGREMRPMLGRKNSMRIDVVHKQLGPDAHMERPWWKDQYEVWCLWAGRPGMTEEHNIKLGVVGEALADRWEFVMFDGVEGGGTSKNACVKKVVEVYLTKYGDLPTERSN